MLLCIGRSEERSLRLRGREYFGEDDPGLLVAVAATVNLPQGRRAQRTISSVLDVGSGSVIRPVS